MAGVRQVEGWSLYTHATLLEKVLLIVHNVN